MSRLVFLLEEHSMKEFLDEFLPRLLPGIDFLYLPRLKDSSVLVEAVRSGLGLLTWAQDSFGYAESFDEAAGRYRGLQGGRLVWLNDDSLIGLLVRSEAAMRQLTAETPIMPGTLDTSGGAVPPPTGGGVSTIQPAPRGEYGEKKPTTPAAPKRFHGSVTLDAARVGRDAGRIADEVIAHLAGLVGSKVTVTLKIEAEVPSGVPEHVVRTVTENCRTLNSTVIYARGNRENILKQHCRMPVCR